MEVLAFTNVARKALAEVVTFDMYVVLRYVKAI
jgi:hypothetical protein